MKKLEERFEILQEVGIDAMKSSRVFLVKDIKNKRRKNNLCLKIAQRDLKREYDILKSLKHPRIPKQHEYGKITLEREKQNFLLRDFVEGTDLHTFYKDYAFKNIKEKTRNIVKDIISTSEVIGYLHKTGKYHCDLKSYDVIKKQNSSHIIDLESILPKGQVGRQNRAFSAPEITGKLISIIPDNRADIYSLGLMIFDLYSAFNEYAIDELRTKKKEYSLEEINEEYDLNIPKNMMSVILRSTSYMPNKRYKTANLFINAIKRVV